ncbi:unnamed protein product [Sphagnum tenellum]
MLTHGMADSWQKYLYKEHQAFAVGPLTSESSVQRLDVLVKTKGSNPVLHNVASIVNLGSKASQKTADPLRNALKHLESNEDDKLYKEQWLGPIEHIVKSRASLKSSLRIFGDAAKLDLDGADVTALLPVGGPPVRGNLSVSATKKTEFKFTVPNNKVRAFGFRAIHAQYHPTGEFFSFVHNEGLLWASEGLTTRLSLIRR